MPWTFDHWWWWQKGFAAFGIAGQSSTGVSGRLQRDLKLVAEQLAILTGSQQELHRDAW